MRLVRGISLFIFTAAALVAQHLAAQERLSRTRPEVSKFDAATMIDPSIVKAIEDEGFLKKLKSNLRSLDSCRMWLRTVFGNLKD